MGFFHVLATVIMLHYHNVVVVQSPSHVWLFTVPWTAACQVSLLLTISWSLPKFVSIEVVMSSNHLILCHPFLLPSIFPRIRVFSRLFTSGGQSIRASASVLPMSIQGLFPLGLTDLTSLCPRDSWESSPAPQFESINSSVLCLFDGPTLISIHGYWKDHSLGYMDLFLAKCYVFAFLIHCLGLS